MCFAVPGRVTEVDGNYATVDFGGAKRRVNIVLIEDVKIGEYVLVHVGYAIQKVSREDAQESIKLWNQILGEEADYRF
jgi:hydrogenase expression/formation protein HypC